MVVLRPLQPAEMSARHASRQRVARRTAAVAAETPTVPMNIGAVLDLGETMYRNFRGKPFGVPPLPWKEGKRLQAAWLAAAQYKSPLTPETAQKYFAAIALIPPILRRNCFPASNWIKRSLWAIGLWPNPFDRMAEEELVEAASFFLQRRMKSGGYALSTRSGPTSGVTR